MRRALDAQDLFPRLFGERHCFSDSLAELVGKEVPEYLWIHVASEGVYKGHWQGEFTLNRAVFESFVKNLREHPQYLQGELPANDDGGGGGGGNGGKPLSVGLKPTIQFDYEHVSEMDPREGTIPERGAPAPAWVCDVELREGPNGGVQLWALAKLGSQIRGQISRNEYRFVSIAFDMKHPHWVTGENQGPTLTSIAFTNNPFLKNLESYAAANRRPASQPSGDRLQTLKSGNEAPGPTPERVPMNAPANAEHLASFEKFRTRICAALKIRTTLADDDIVEAATEASSSSTSLAALLEALGQKDAAGALTALPAIMGARAQLADALAELDGLLQGQMAQETAMADGDAAAVMKAKGWKDDTKKALLAARKEALNEAEAKAPKGADGKVSPSERIKARAEGRAQWLKEYGVDPNAQVDTTQLSQPRVAAAGGTQLRVDGKRLTGTVISAEQDSVSDGDVVDLSKQPGANPVEKVMRHLAAKDPEGYGKRSHFDKVKQASAFLEANQVQF